MAGGLRSRAAARTVSRRSGRAGSNVFHVIPEAAIADADRYRGTDEDETRLFYVAVTRAQKYLLVSFSPGRTSGTRSGRRSSTSREDQSC